MVLLLNICLDLKDSPEHFNVIRLCAFILQSLSAEKAFGSKLNKPIVEVPGGNKHAVVQNGTAADFLITVSGSLRSLFLHEYKPLTLVERQSVATMIFTTHNSFNVSVQSTNFQSRFLSDTFSY